MTSFLARVTSIVNMINVIRVGVGKQTVDDFHLARSTTLGLIWFSDSELISKKNGAAQ